jgi:hypothetical protein
MAYEIEDAFDARNRALNKSSEAVGRPLGIAEVVSLSIRRLDQPVRWEDLRVEPGRPSLEKAMRIPEYMYSWFGPTIMRLRSKQELPDCWAWNISQKVRDLLEEVAPGEGQFIPASLIEPDGTPITKFGRRWFMNVLNYVSPAELFKGTNAKVTVTEELNARNELYTKYLYEKQTARAPLSKKSPGYEICASGFEGMNIFWCFQAIDQSSLKRWQTYERDLFVSNALGDGMKRVRISGVRLPRTVEVCPHQTTCGNNLNEQYGGLTMAGTVAALGPCRFLRRALPPRRCAASSGRTGSNSDRMRSQSRVRTRKRPCGHGKWRRSPAMPS